MLFLWGTRYSRFGTYLTSPFSVASCFLFLSSTFPALHSILALPRISHPPLLLLSPALQLSRRRATLSLLSADEITAPQFAYRPAGRAASPPPLATAV